MIGIGVVLVEPMDLTDQYREVRRTVVHGVVGKDVHILVGWLVVGKQFTHAERVRDGMHMSIH
ncbi:hypothetical protein D3C75_738340 [compost metagenome]